MRYIAIVGTNASFSYNRKLLWYMKKHFEPQAQIEVVEIADLPLFCEDFEQIPTRILEIVRAIEAADGVIFSTPEYDHAITASLKSLIEWLSWKTLQPLVNRPVMIVGVSLGNMGTVFAQENLRQILSSPGLDAFVLPTHQFLLGRAVTAFNAQDELVDERTIEWLEQCFEQFMRYAKTLKPLRESASRSLVSKDEPQNIERWIQGTPLGLAVASDADTGASESEARDEGVKSVYDQLFEGADIWAFEELDRRLEREEKGRSAAQSVGEEETEGQADGLREDLPQ